MAKCHVSQYTNVACESFDEAKVSPFELQSEFQPNRMCCSQYRHVSLPAHIHTAMSLKLRQNTLLLTEQWQTLNENSVNTTSAATYAHSFSSCGHRTDW